MSAYESVGPVTGIVKDQAVGSALRWAERQSPGGGSATGAGHSDRKPEAPERPKPGLVGYAEQLGMSVAELVATLGKGTSIQELFIQRGVWPMPGTLVDLAG